MRQVIKALAFIASAVLLVSPAFAFDGKAASEVSARLTQADLDAAWSHFEAAVAARKNGNGSESLRVPSEFNSSPCST